MNPLTKINHHYNLSPVQVRLALSSPAGRLFTSSPTTSCNNNNPISNANRRIALAVDMRDESGYAVKWAIQNYLRPGDAVILLHVRPTSVLYGADWGSCTTSSNIYEREQLEDDFDNFTNTKAAKLSEPLAEAMIPFKIHIVKDHDLKERLCLEVERLGLSAVIMGSRGFGGAVAAAKGGRRSSFCGKLGRLGSVRDYCVRHCVCPVVVVRYPDDNEIRGGSGGDDVAKAEDYGVLHPVKEEDQEYHDADDQNGSIWRRFLVFGNYIEFQLIWN